MSNRVGRAQRSTSESQISVVIDLDGTGRSDISTCLLYTSDAADDAPRV